MLVDLSQRDLDLRMARQRGMDCLGSDNSWVGRSQRPRPAELQAIRVEQVGCVTWANLAWARWLEHRGVTGAGIDLEPLEALARRAVELDPDYDRGRSRAVLGLVLSLSSRDEQGLEESARELLAAQRARPERHVVDLDLARRVYQPLGRQEEWQESLSRVLSGTDSSEPFEALENQWARAQAQDALLRGFVRPGEKNGSNSREVRESGD
jgi:hypothetical protein